VPLDEVIVPRKAPPAPTAFPLLPATAAAFLLLGLAQLAFWWWESRLPYFNYTTGSATQRISSKEAAANPFIALSQPAMPDTAAVQMREVQRISAPTLPQNVQFGDALARVTVTIFTDPSCGPCREKVRAWTAGLPAQGVRQVYKFWPQVPGRTTPGILVELARRQGEIGDFWRAIQGAAADNLDDLRMLTMLDNAGLPLAEQRAMLTTDGASLMSALEPDIATAREARLPPPPVLVVDDYVLDGRILSPEGLGGYVKKRLEGRQIFENDDLFLMKK
jgi:hypothetical protein